MLFRKKVRVGKGTRIIFEKSGFQASFQSYAFSGIQTEILDTTDLASPEPAADDGFGGMEFEASGGVTQERRGGCGR